MKMILITGCSSGFGLETAKYFLERGWKVIATMRVPDATVLPPSEHLRVLPLDVTKLESIRSVIEAAGPIDALVNNAGIGTMCALEGAPMERFREIFDTNTFGTIAMSQAVIPQLRERRSGVIVNVTSTVTLKSIPLLSIYTASKAAINAFTECLALELQQFNVRACLVLPGRAPDTRFAENARVQALTFPEPYVGLAQMIFAEFANSTGPVTHSKDVAEAVWKTVTDPSTPAFLPAGADAIAWAEERDARR
ncbi:short-chain dehydrogenase/reductase [Verrucomicrobia bacterium LW23]|nr:short-chain dehydrogenase/reductase [Verrucomicrobia bacterium LW23]